MTRSHRKCSQCSARKKVRLLQDCRRCLYRMNGSCLTNPQREGHSQSRLRSARTTWHFVRIDLTMTGTCPSVHRVCAGATSFRLPCRSLSVTARLLEAFRRQETVCIKQELFAIAKSIEPFLGQILCRKRKMCSGESPSLMLKISLTSAGYIY